MLKQGLELKQTQKLSPLQIQTIKLIELPVQELEQRVKAELEDNPVLDDSPAPIPSYKLRVNNYGKDERPQYNTFSVKESFTQSLMEQLGYRNLSKHDRDVAAFIIGSLDSDGYLRRDIDSIVDDLAFRANIESTPEEVTAMLKVIQEFEPAGVGARDLRECLLLQLRTQKQTRVVQLAETILTDYFQEFSNRHFQKIITRLGLDEDEMKAVMARIVKLNPAPGGQIDDSYNDQAQQIVPDFVLDIVDGELKLSMPRFNIPEIRVNRKYAELLAQAEMEIKNIVYDEKSVPTGRKKRQPPSSSRSWIPQNGLWRR